MTATTVGPGTVANGNITDAQRAAARAAAIALLLGFAIVLAGEFWVGANLVADDAAATARNIIAHETLFRLHVAFDVLYAVAMLVLAAALYVVLEPAGRGLALVAALSRLAYASMWIAIALDMLGALRLLHAPGYLTAFDPAHLQALARARLGSGFDAYYVGLPFFALASTICAYLWHGSRLVPRLLAGFGFAASAWCAACAIVFLVFPDFSRIVNDWWFDTPMGVFELMLGSWLLFAGLQPAVADRRAAANAGVAQVQG